MGFLFEKARQSFLHPLRATRSHNERGGFSRDEFSRFVGGAGKPCQRQVKIPAPTLFIFIPHLLEYPARSAAGLTKSILGGNTPLPKVRDLFEVMLKR